MSFRMFHEICQEIAFQETRSIALAPALLELTKGILLSSPDYVERIKRHYTLVRGIVDG